MFCKHCGQQMEEGAKFCAKCGESVEATTVIDNALENETSTHISNSNEYQAPNQFASTSNYHKSTNKFNKKILIIVVAIVVVAALVVAILLGTSNGSNNGSALDNPNSNVSNNNPKETEFENANKAYENLVSAHELCVDIMDSIYNAWFFAIYEADDYSSSYRMINAFANKTDLTSSEVEEALESLGYSSSNYYLLEEFDYAVYVVKYALQQKGVYKQAEDHLLQAKNSLKEVTSEYQDYTGYPTLKSYYSEVSSYLEFATSPSGSFSQLKTTIDNYETKMRTYKNDLSFIFE